MDLYDNIHFAASGFQKDISEKDHFFFEYQKFCCPTVSYHIVFFLKKKSFIKHIELILVSMHMFNNN